MAPGRDELGASAVGGVLGGLVLGGVLQATTRTVQAIGGTVGAPTLASGWMVLLGTSLVFGVGYAVVVTRYVDGYVSVVLALTARSEPLKEAVMPLARRFGMALLVTTAMGIGYGLAVGIAFGGLVLPVLAASGDLPLLEPAVVVGYVLYGGVLGGCYGNLVVN